mmetsp:Transcript_20522/g.30711  ORF Transcript_20522/g.30711 Transcript_20522/m.30711 type:complete len:656 (-) Transcript_20522:76-2043(-)
MSVRRLADLRSLLTQPIDKSRDQWSRFFYHAHHQNAYRDVLREGFKEIMNKLFGPLGNPSERCWMSTVGEYVSGSTIRNLFTIRGEFFAALKVISSNKYANGVLVSWNDLPHSTREMLKKRKYKKLSPLYRKIGDRMVELSHLEYFFFRFMHYIVSRSAGNEDWGDSKRLPFVPDMYRIRNKLKPGLDDETTYQLLLQDYLSALFPSDQREVTNAFLFVFGEVWLSQNSMETTVFKIPNKLMLHSIERVLAHISGRTRIGTNGLLDPTLRGQLFGFFYCCFVRWPENMMNRFQEIASLWLLYIQPWKGREYLNIVLKRERSAKGRGMKMFKLHAKAFFSPLFSVRILGTVRKYNENWMTFIQGNLFFYTTLYTEFLSKASRLNFHSHYSNKESTRMLNFILLRETLRVFTVKVRKVISNCEQIALERRSSRDQVKFYYLASFTVQAGLRNKGVKPKDIRDLFCGDMRRSNAQELFMQLPNVSQHSYFFPSFMQLNEIREKIDTQKCVMWEFLGFENMINVDENRALKEIKAHLQDQFRVHAAVLPRRRDRKMGNTSYQSSSNDSRPPVLRVRDPWKSEWERPATSGENILFLFFFLWLSDRINKYVIFNLNRFLFHICPCCTCQVPRISLSFLANYKNLFWIIALNIMLYYYFWT